MTEPLSHFAETICPTDEAGVAEAVRRAAGSGTPVWPIGGGTRFDSGLTPTNGEQALPGLGLSLAKLNRVVDHAVADLTVTAESGMTVAALSKTLAAKRQRLPVDVPRPDRATLGGLVAANPAGPRRYGYGTIRDYLLGFRAVDGQGTIFSGGGRVVKNAAGYNVHRLMVGSRGTLGVLTQVTFMVRPMVDASALLVLGVPDPDTAEHLLAGLAQMPSPPVAIELLAGPTWRDDPAIGPWCDESGRDWGLLLVGFEGGAAEIGGTVERLTWQWRQSGVGEPTTVAPSKIEAVYRRLTDFAVPGEDPERPLVVRMALRPGAIASTAARLRELDAACSIDAHAGDGVLRARFACPAERIERFIREQLRPLAAKSGGVHTIVAAPAEAKLDRPTIWGPPGDLAAGVGVMRAIKERLDPKNVLCPGEMGFETE